VYAPCFVATKSAPSAEPPPSYTDALVDIFGGTTEEQTTVDGFGSPPDEVTLTPGWEDGYKVFHFKNSGILFENGSIQIGVKSSFKGNLGRVCVFYGNKCGSPLNAFMVDLLDVDESLGVTSKPPPHMLESGAQVQQLFEVECKGVFTSSPKLRIRFNRDGGPMCIVLRLPVLLNKFLEPLSSMSASDFFQRWKQLGDKQDQEAQSIFDAKFPIEKDSAGAKLLGFGVSVLADIDPNPDNFVSAGIINASSTRVGCLLRLEPNKEIKKYRLTIRSSNAAVSQHMLDILKTEF
jgi:AP-2 complex subunit alpha